MQWLSSLKLLAVALATLLYAGAACSQMQIVVEATTKEAVGGRLAFAIKERIRTSAGFKLVGDRAEALFRMSLVTLDDKSGYSTVYSVVFSAWQPQTGTWTYLENIVGTCGTSRIAECAEALVADADRTAEEPRAFYRTYLKNEGKN